MGIEIFFCLFWFPGFGEKDRDFQVQVKRISRGLRVRLFWYLGEEGERSVSESGLWSVSERGLW